MRDALPSPGPSTQFPTPGTQKERHPKVTLLLKVFVVRRGSRISRRKLPTLTACLLTTTASCRASACPLLRWGAWRQLHAMH